MGLGAQCEAARELLPCADSDDWFDSADSERVLRFALASIACAWLCQAGGLGVDGAGVPSDTTACETAGRGGGGGGFGVEGAATASIACAWLFRAGGLCVDGAGVPSDTVACEAAGRVGAGGGVGFTGAAPASEPGAVVPQSIAGIGGGGGVGG